MPKIKFDLKAHEAKMRVILNPPPPVVTELGLPNLAEKIKSLGRIKGK